MLFSGINDYWGIMKKALLTIGNTLRGDDGAGYALGQIVEERSGWKVFQGEDCPENQIHLIRDFAPDLLVVADTVLGIDEGDAQFLDIAEDDIPAFTTHTMPVQYLIRFIEDFCDSILFLGIGVAKEKMIGISHGLSENAHCAVAKAEKLIIKIDEMLA